MANPNSFDSKSSLSVGGTDYTLYRIDKVAGHERLPFSLKVLLENLLRTEDGANVTKAQIEAIGSWDPSADPHVEIQFTPARVVLQDFTGVPCIVDLATMREAVAELGGDAGKINPLAPVELVIDHSVIADLFGTADAFERNVEIEYQRNGERYQFLRWGQTAFDDFKVVPPGTGIVPVSLKPRTCGISIEIGCPSMAASASMPPTPQPATPSPFTMVVCESVPTSVSG